MAETPTVSLRTEQARRHLAAGDLVAARREAEAIVVGEASDAERAAAQLVLARGARLFTARPQGVFRPGGVAGNLC